MMHTRARWRGIGGMIVTLVALACLLISGISGTVAADDGPAIDMITLSASTVARGDTVTVNAHITDAVADVLDTPVVFFALPDDFAGPGIPFTRVSGDARDGRYHADWVVSPLLPVGKYPVREVRAYDGNGSSAFVTQPDPRVAALIVTVTDNPNATVTATASPAMATGVPATATTGATAATPATSTAARVTSTPVPAMATSSRPTPTPMFTPVPPTGPGPDATNTPAPATTVPTVPAARVTVLPAATVPSPATRASVSTGTVAVAPAMGTPPATRPPLTTTTTTTAATASSAPAATAAFVTRPTTSTPSPRPSTGKPPSLASLTVALASVSSAPTTVYPGDTLTVTARITAAGSADVVDRVQLRYRLPDGTDGPFAYLRRVSGTARDGTYSATLGLSPFFPAGMYTLGTLTIADSDGNTTVYTGDMRPDATFTVTLFVPPDTSAMVCEGYLTQSHTQTGSTADLFLSDTRCYGKP